MVANLFFHIASSNRPTLTSFTIRKNTPIYFDQTTPYSPSQLHVPLPPPSPTHSVHASPHRFSNKLLLPTLSYHPHNPRYLAP